MAAPKLRFKEFDGDWCFRKIGDISECIVPGRNKPKLFDGDIPWVTTPDLKDKTYVSDTRSNYYISEEEAKSVGSKIVPTNSVIMSCVGDLGLFAINTKPIVINQQLHAFILDDHKYSSIFVLNALSKNQDYIERVATKTALPYLNKDNCNSIPLFLCSFKEQTKIASFLSNVDEKISQLTKKHELLSQYKQGMMQKLFSQQIRFKADDGSAFGEWEDLKICDLVRSLDAGVSVNSEDIKPTNDEYSVLKTSCISSGYFDENERKRVLLEEEINRLKEPVLDNSILMSRMNTPLLVGMNAYIEKAPKNTYLPDRLWQLKINADKVLTRWLAFYLGSENGLSQIRDLASGTSNSMKNIKKSDVLNLEIFVPSKEEQTKIANFLSAVDQKIEVVAQQIEQAKTWKKGLLQQMFV